MTASVFDELVNRCWDCGKRATHVGLDARPRCDMHAGPVAPIALCDQCLRPLVSVGSFGTSGFCGAPRCRACGPQERCMVAPMDDLVAAIAAQPDHIEDP